MEFHVTIDFYDDMVRTEAAWDERALRETVRGLAERGITTIHWIDYGRFDNGLWEGASYLNRDGLAQELAETVPDPLGVVCDEAHDHGLRVYSVIKPWDFAFPLFSDGGSEDVLIPHLGGMGSAARFIRENPHVRLRLHPDCLPAEWEADQPIETIRLWHETADEQTPPEISLYVSEDNRTYTEYEGPVEVTSTRRWREPPEYAPAPKQAYGDAGQYACLELTDLAIDAPFVAIEPEASTGITNALEALVEVLGPDERPLTFTHGMCTDPSPFGGSDDADWRETGIAHDHRLKASPVPRHFGHGARSAGRLTVDLDEIPILGIARGRNEYLQAPIEYAYPEVQEWLLSVVDDALDSGVDGVDIRPSTHTESLDWENYGFNEPVVEAYRERHGVDPLTQPFDRGAWRDLRAEFFDEFLEAAAERVHAAGGSFQAHLKKSMDLPADQPGYLGMTWHWDEWIEDGVIDSANFKFVNFDHPFFEKALAECRTHGVDTIHTRFLPSENRTASFEADIERARAEGLEVVNLYELAKLATLRADGTMDFHDELWDVVQAESD